MITQKQPIDFNPRYEVSSLFCEVNGEFILLKRQLNKTQAERWGVPAGKNDGQELIDAIIRETKEETGITLQKSDLKFFKKLYVRYSDYDFVYYIFHTILPQKPEIVLSLSEHTEYVWATPQEALKMDLVEDLDSCIEMFYNI